MTQSGCADLFLALRRALPGHRTKYLYRDPGYREYSPVMPTTAYVDDVVSMASALYANPELQRLILDPESAELAEFGPLPEVTSLRIAVDIPGRDYFAVTATQQLVQARD